MESQGRPYAVVLSRYIERESRVCRVPARPVRRQCTYTLVEACK